MLRRQPAESGRAGHPHSPLLSAPEADDAEPIQAAFIIRGLVLGPFMTRLAGHSANLGGADAVGKKTRCSEALGRLVTAGGSFVADGKAWRRPDHA